MILFNENIQQSILLYNYLKKQLEEEILMKTNIIYFEKDTLLDFNNIKSEIFTSIDEYIYYYLNDLFKINLDINIHNNFKKNICFNNMSTFSYKKDGFFSNGNVIILYFSTPYLSNPLDILYTVISNINVTKKYFDIKIDYLPYRDEIIYFIMFRYSSYYENNINEIIDIKETIMNITTIQTNKDIFPKIQINFEKKFFNSFDKINYIKGVLKFKGMSKFTPFYKISSESENTACEI